MYNFSGKWGFLLAAAAFALLLSLGLSIEESGRYDVAGPKTSIFGKYSLPQDDNWQLAWDRFGNTCVIIRQGPWFDAIKFYDDVGKSYTADQWKETGNPIYSAAKVEVIAPRGLNLWRVDKTKNPDSCT